MSLLKKLVSGFVFGLGFSVALILVYTIWLWLALPKVMEESLLSDFPVGSYDADESRETVSQAPPVSAARRYKGSTGTYDGEFDVSNYQLLAAGPGTIVGQVISDGKPVAGLKLRLGLNKQVMTEWGVSDETGQYEISVPFGDYQVDAFQLDQDSANQALPGMIGHPGRLLLRKPVLVAENQAGKGPDFEFVKPIVKAGPSGMVSEPTDLTIRWEPYPLAAEYVVQIYEIPHAGDHSTVRALFDFRNRPKVSEPELTFSEHGIEPVSGMGYRFTVSALNSDGARISETADHYSVPDFTYNGEH